MGDVKSTPKFVVSISMYLLEDTHAPTGPTPLVRVYPLRPPGLSLEPPHFSSLPMQSTAGLKKRSPFTFASDEDNSLANAGILDDQRKSEAPSSGRVWCTSTTSFNLSHVAF
jgi:hypothetical protein